MEDSGIFRIHMFVGGIYVPLIMTFVGRLAPMVSYVFMADGHKISDCYMYLCTSTCQ